MQARRFGAAEVHAAAVRVQGVEDALDAGVLDSYVSLAPATDRSLAVAARG